MSNLSDFADKWLKDNPVDYKVPEWQIKSYWIPYRGLKNQKEIDYFRKYHRKVKIDD